MMSALRELMGAKVRAVWNTWLGRVADQQMMVRAASGLVAPGLKKALMSWLEFAEDRATRLHSLRGALWSLQHQGARRAMNLWVDAAKEKARRLHSLRAALWSLQTKGPAER